jgi:hypothetical protein
LAVNRRIPYGVVIESSERIRGDLRAIDKKSEEATKTLNNAAEQSS